MTRPLLSVVIPTRNRAHLVCEAIESALGQRSGQVEVIVVDDGSTDDTTSLLTRTYGSRIKLLTLPERKGVGAARNAGVRLATGEVLGFLDDDDLWLPGKLDAELRVFQQYPEAEAVVSDSLSFLEGEPAAQTFFAKNGLLAASRGCTCWVSECDWLWTNSMNGVAMCSMTLRRSLWERLGETLFAEDLTTCEDWELEMRVYYLGKVVVLPEVWAQVRLFDDGSRIGRATTGKPKTREQEIGYLRDRLKVMERSHWLSGLRSDLATELERYREDTTCQLARLETA
ncbi:MAG TPA: glycosyltransferase [Pyrinomonadaceae bacterium]|jgi:glycosyltransferase involved in cell wall biosynthesis|nr:glycosyltransferase [Pyrinomonadaceae bacterium]